MKQVGKCTRCNWKWYICENCRAAGCGNSDCSNYQWKSIHVPFTSPKCRTCGKN